MGREGTVCRRKGLPREGPGTNIRERALGRETHILGTKGFRVFFLYRERRWRFGFNDKLGLGCFGIDILIEMGVMVVEVDEY